MNSGADRWPCPAPFVFLQRTIHHSSYNICGKDATFMSSFPDGKAVTERAAPHPGKLPSSCRAALLPSAARSLIPPVPHVCG